MAIQDAAHHLEHVFPSKVPFVMPRRKPFSDEEKGQILAWEKDRLSESEIEKRLERSRGAVRNFLSSPRPQHQKSF